LVSRRLVAVRTAGLDLTRSLRAVWSTSNPLSPLASRLLTKAQS
jgi:hypothetical protein